jgi:hypothetical protein
LLNAQLNSAMMQVAAAQKEVAGASARQEVAGPEQFASLPEGIRVVQERVQEGANVLVDILDSLDPSRPGNGTAPPGNLPALAYTDIARVASSLDTATELLQELARKNTDSPLRGELVVISHRLVVARNDTRGLLSRLSQISGNGGNGGTSRTLSIVDARLQVAVDHLEAGDEAAQDKLQGGDSAGVGEAAAKFMEEVDTAASILGLVVNDLVGIQETEVTQERLGQLGILADRVKATQGQVRRVSSQLQQTQQGQAADHLDLQRLKADYEDSLLNSHQTGITMVDIAVTFAENDGWTTLLSKIGIPLGGLAGFLLSTMLVLVKSQMNPRASRPGDSGGWSE